MTGPAHKAIIRRLYDEVFNQDRLDVADELARPDFAIHDRASDQSVGPDAIKATQRRLRAAFPDLQIHIEDMVAENDRVAVRWIMRGTQSSEFMGRPATGQPVAQHAIVIFRFDGDQLAETWPVIANAR